MTAAEEQPEKPAPAPVPRPPPGQILTGKQEHYLKRELMSEQVSWEISELNSPTALQRFGAPFRSDQGEVSPHESELPILRYIFVNHVRDFPFLDKAKEKEFWQDKLQIFLESFAMKQISSSEDRLEETKRRKLAIKSRKLVELMMVSGIPTSSGFEERIRFSEIEIVDSNAIDRGVMNTIPEGNYIHGWDVNVAGVRSISVKRNIRYHKHAEFVLRIKRKGELEYFVGRRYGSFAKLYRNLRNELPGRIANTKAMHDFLTGDPITPTDEDVEDIIRRKVVDEKRVEEQKKFYEIARKRAAELDEYMEQFRRDIVERNGLTLLFKEIREKETIGDLSLQYRKFCEWLRIEIAAVIYHLFLAEDNSADMFAQAKRVHSLIPYSIMKNVIRIANPAAVMSGILEIFLAQPFGTRSLMQRMFSLALHDGIRSFQKSIDALDAKIGDPVFTQKIKLYTHAEEDVKKIIRQEAEDEQIDLIVSILRSDLLEPELTGEQVQRLYNAYVAFNNAVENIDDELKQGAQLFSYLKQLLKLCTRYRDKTMMLRLIEEPVTLQLLKDLFTIFYEPLVRVYKSANVYNSVTDFAVFIDDMIEVVEKCREEDASADPNQTVQAFIDLCQRHEHNFYKFIHEVHIHDNGLFAQIMGWIEGILDFLRKGPKNGTLNMNALFEGGISGGLVDKDKAIEEINSLIAWQEARKKWHSDKTQQKMAAEGNPGGHLLAPDLGLNPLDFGLNRQDLEDLDFGDGSDDAGEAEAEDELDPIQAERRRRSKRRDHLRRSAGEPVKPAISEVHKLKDNFLAMLRNVLAD
ncbi:PX domain-containing protein [Escovopsis weberi]|uniref:PX domain-containing protein n=1 Tax=Escovopsis weberi TaxID=150374 RepID=A0A0M8N442_ESCWE|nr:PX domain-containing protein [Escovopsis weberi]